MHTLKLIDTMTQEQLFLMPFFGHFALIVILFVWLTYERQTAVKRGEVKVDDFAKAGADPMRSMRVARNLSNQFELPMFALWSALFLTLTKAIGPIDIAAAWVFLAGRIIHTLVQTMTGNVALRGIVFTINFVAVLVLMGRVAQEVFGRGIH